MRVCVDVGIPTIVGAGAIDIVENKGNNSISMGTPGQMTAAEALNHPLLFTFRDAISGDGFLAGITLSGRILMVEEDGKWWVYGVRPGAIAESGEYPQDALVNFRKRYKEVLFDIAGEYRTFDDFRGEVERFFYEPDPEEERRWEDALTRIRSKEAVSRTVLPELPAETPERRPSQISVERLDVPNRRFKPTDNVPDMMYSAIAA
jgi:hypothetical protein